jgi:hypothetical protein
MINAWSQFWSSFASVFSSISKGASAIDHLAGIAEQEAAGLATQMDVEREARLASTIKKLKAA